MPESRKLLIVAHSRQQYDKCQDYLKGEVKIGSMYPLMITYYTEIMTLYHGRNINITPDEDVATEFCLHLIPPTNE